MKKISVALAIAAALLTGQSQAEPTRAFTLETARTAEDGSFSVDLINTVNSVHQVRFGAFQGEVLINPDGAGVNPSVGYKRILNDTFAVFGTLGLNSQDGADNEFLIGGAFSSKAEQISLNANATLGSQNDDTVFSVGAGAFLPLEASGKLSKFQVGAELFVSNGDNSEIGFNLGGRWAPRESVTVDLLLLAKPPVKKADTFFATPAGVRINVAF